MALFDRCKTIWKEVIKLKAAGQHQQAKEIARSEYAAQTQQIKGALSGLNTFLKKRVEALDTTVSRVSEK